MHEQCCFFSNLAISKPYYGTNIKHLFETSKQLIDYFFNNLWI